MKIVVRIAVVVVLFVIMVGLNSRNENKKDGEVREQAAAIVQGLPEYDGNKSFFDEALAQHHREAFVVSYIPAKRGRSAKFDEESYFATLFGKFMTQAEEKGNTKVYEAMASRLKTMRP